MVLFLIGCAGCKMNAADGRKLLYLQSMEIMTRLNILFSITNPLCKEQERKNKYHTPALLDPFHITLVFPTPVIPDKRENEQTEKKKKVMRLCTYQFSINHHP